MPANEPLGSVADTREARAFMPNQPNQQPENPFDDFAEDGDAPELRRGEATDDAFLEFESEYDAVPGTTTVLDRIPPAVPEAPSLVQLEAASTLELEPVTTFEPEPLLTFEPEPVLTFEPEPVLTFEPEPEPVLTLQTTQRMPAPVLTGPAARYAKPATATPKALGRGVSASRWLNALTVLALGAGAALAAFGLFRAFSPDEIAGTLPLPPVAVIDLPQAPPPPRTDTDGPETSAPVEGDLGTTVALAPGTEPNPPAIEQQTPPAMPAAAAAAETDRTNATPSQTSQAPLPTSTVASGGRGAAPEPAAEPPTATAVGTLSDSLALTAPLATPEAPPSTPEAVIVERAGAPSAAAPAASAEGVAIPGQPLTPPAEAAVPAVEAARVVSTSAVESILNRYSNAFTALDARQVQTIWPTVDARALDRAFDSLQRQELDLGACEIRVTGSRATAACAGSTRYVPKIGNRTVREQPLMWTFVLLRGNTGEWAIQSVHTQQ